MNTYTDIIVGSGYAGAVSARLLSERPHANVLLLEKRGHIAGNMYDYLDETGVRVHKYGPHIAVMKNQRTFNFLSRFTQWLPYEHKVLALIDGKEVPLPFNFNSILILFGKQEGMRLISALLDEFAAGENVPILRLRQSSNPTIKELAQYIYEKVFLHYTTKMWGLDPEHIDPAVTARVPVRMSFDDRHFQMPFQVMPKYGYTSLFMQMLNQDNITIRLNTNALDVLHLDETTHTITFEGKPFTGRVIYTGALDELFRYRFGALPYRSLKFEFTTHNTPYVQKTAVLNYPDERPQTRRTEMKHLTMQDDVETTTTITEYPGAYDRNDPDFSEPYYPIVKDEYHALHERYAALAKTYKGLYPIGRLADYRYYNMEATILRTLDFIASL